ncbi:F-box protein At1g47340 [Amborella trichopoda]|uniref:F-box domain-containing protein n=1 Tax=Amborella trichopoda TaxID=13333 RepID=W1PEZ4_AMBTC|nr:F-box protein At1g47340 [Amborella trichopoda]ERN06543.1 hypothetical protein AMTR_s00058p00114730 [Amborella trichopoda]|eukprot:XP_006844868.1 F-box protein At1g47340 [Amborella trichopoda]
MATTATVHLSVKSGKDRLSNVLPNELVEKILLLLPVKSILCFQSVWKLWNCFLSSPSFARIHALSSSSALSKPFTFFLSMDDYVMSLHDTDNELSCHETKIRAPWVLPSFHSSLGSRIVGSNGVLCIFNRENNGRISVIDVFYIANPATGQFTTIPYFPDHVSDQSSVYAFFGFHFDPESRDFKIMVGIRSDDWIENFEET